MAISTVLQKFSMATVGAAFIALGTVGIEKAEALTLGPDSYGYRATDEVPYTFQDISGTGSRVLSGVDDSTSSANLGFNFNFYGTNYNSVFFSSNGLMTFGGSNSSFSNSSFTGSLGTNRPTIAAFWDDLQFFQSGTDAVYYQTVGTAGSRRFITQWNNVGGFSSSPSLMTFQSVLFEGSNNILLSYLDADSGDFRAFGGSATVGIRNTDGDLNGQNLQWSYDSASLRNGQSILISRSVPEPASVLGLLAVGALGAASVSKRKQQQKANG